LRRRRQTLRYRIPDVVRNSTLPANPGLSDPAGGLARRPRRLDSGRLGLRTLIWSGSSSWKRRTP